MKLATRYASPPGLSEIERAVQNLRQPVVIVQASPHQAAETQQLARIAELEAALAAATRTANTVLERAHREDRLDRLTKRVVDRRAEWYAKQPRVRLPHIIVSPTQVITTEVWEHPPAAE